MDCGISLGLNKWSLATGLGLLSFGGYEAYQLAVKPVATARHFSIQPMEFKVPEGPKPISEVKETPKEKKPTVETPPEIKNTVQTPEPKPKPVNKPTITQRNWKPNGSYVGIYVNRSHLTRIR